MERHSIVALGDTLPGSDTGRRGGQSAGGDGFGPLLPAHENVHSGRRHADDGNATPLSSGRFAGGDADAALDLRLDTELGAISGDIFRHGNRGRVWSASFRTLPGAVIVPDAPLRIISKDRHGDDATGTFLLGTNPLEASISFDRRLDGLPVRMPIRMPLERRSDAFRQLDLDVKIERNVAPPAAASTPDGEIDLAGALLGAGMETRMGGGRGRFPPAPPNGWSEKHLFTLLHDLAGSDRPAPEMALRMLWLSRSNRPRLNGIMFDFRDSHQRQGFAVFTDSITDNVHPSLAPVKLVQTALHEAGHSLNLRHRFEREIGRADSLSPMNYDWRYRGGGLSDAYWRDFRFRFDPDELDFLRHASWLDFTPGGSPFGSSRYWRDATGGYSPYVNEFDMPDWNLEILPPRSGPVFEFAQPVFLGIRLTDTAGRAFPFPADVLDVKTGFVDIVIERETGAGHHADALSAHPIVHRLMDMGAPQRDEEARDDPEILERNVNLVFGSSGFAFAEPGNYKVTAFLAIPYSSVSGAEGDIVVRSAPMRLRISMPQTRSEENAALDILEANAGRILALGTVDHLGDAADRLRETADRLNGNRTKDGTISDPVSVCIYRALALGATRDSYRLQGDKVVHRPADLEEARRLFRAIPPKALDCLDPVTYRETLLKREEVLAG